MRTAVSLALGSLLVLAGAAFAAFGSGAASFGTVALAAVALVAVGGLLGAVVKLAGRVDAGDDAAAAPWREAGALTDRAPERSSAEDDLSGEALAGIVEEAGDAARDDGTVDGGLEVVRPHLRRALIDALVQGGTDRESARAALADGAWTDDRVAAAVLDEDVARPGRSLRDRVRAWLFPEQILRADVQRAVQAIAAVADADLPTVPGRAAPRTVPVVRPRLADLRRGADGRLQRAVDPLAVDPAPGERPADVPETDDESAGDAERGDDGATETGADDGERSDPGVEPDDGTRPSPTASPRADLRLGGGSAPDGGRSGDDPASGDGVGEEDDGGERDDVGEGDGR